MPPALPGDAYSAVGDTKDGAPGGWGMDLKYEQWAILEPLNPTPSMRPDAAGALGAIRARCSTASSGCCGPVPHGRACRIGARLQQPATGVFEQILHALAEDLRERGRLDLTECFVDGSFEGAKKGGFVWARQSAGKAQSS